MTYLALVAATPFYDPRGWMQWPCSEHYSFQFMQILGAAQDGGSTVSECFLAASGIRPGDDESWFREWKKLADHSMTRGDIARRRGHLQTALSNWLRALNYYRTAKVFLASDDSRHAAVVAAMQACSRLHLQWAGNGTVIDIAGPDGEIIQGYFLPAPNQPGPSPAVICFGGPDHRKEEFLHNLPRYALSRGLSLLLVDPPRARRGAADEGGSNRYDVEAEISGWVDVLLERDDVDPERIAIFGDGLGATFATRGAGLDDRLAAAVCDGGIWDLHERAFVAGSVAGCCGAGDHGGFDKLSSNSIARNIRCPILVTIGEYDWLDAAHVTSCCQALRAAGLDIDLKVFRASETAAGPSHVDNPTLAYEFTFDWIADRLASRLP